MCGIYKKKKKKKECESKRGTIRDVRRENGEGEGRLERVMTNMNKVHHIHVWKRHNECHYFV
jgi:hypothetical protein